MSYIYLNPVFLHGTEPYPRAGAANHSVFPLMGTVCTVSTVDVSPLIDLHLLPLYEATKNMWAPAVKPLTEDITMGKPGSDIYASLYPVDKPRPASVVKKLPARKEGGGMKKVDFEKARVEGKIVLQRRLVAETQSIVSPGVRKTDLSSKVIVPLRRGRGGTFPKGTSVPCNYTGILSESPPCVLVSSAVSHVIEERPYVRYDRYYWSGQWEYPSHEQVVWMMESVQNAAIAAPLDHGVVTSALAEANNRYWDVLTEIAELPELVRYIIDGLKEVLNLAKTFKKAKRDLLKSGGSLSELSSLWLQFRYAVMPVVYSIEDVMETLSSPSTVFLSTRKRTNSFIDLPKFDGWTGSGDFPVQQRCFLKRKFDLAVGDSVFLTVNPLLTAWEKVPLSFVIDWAINVGDVLTSLIAPSGIEEEKALYSNRVPKGTTLTYVSDNHFGMSVEISTGVYNAYPINPLANIGFTLGLEMDWRRQLDALALTWQIFLKQYFGR